MKPSVARMPLLAALGAAICAAVIAACGGGGYGGSAYVPPGGNPSPAASPTAGPLVHINFFGSGNGSISTAPFGVVSGFTQQAHAQVIGFQPGEQIMITNNDTVTHTLNVFANSFPTPGPQSTAAVPNGGVFGPGYQSGPITPGSNVGPLTVTNAAGNLYIICGIHFVDGMQDGVVVQVNATPGPEATPTSGGGGCHGYGC
jgi:hypothetical protein